MRRIGAVALAFAFALTACTLLLDRSSKQCSSDTDCEQFGGHPLCQNGVCAASGLGPADCFFGAANRPQDFANQCSTAQCLPFDNCQRLGLCGGATDADAGLIPPIRPDAGATGGGGTGDADGGVSLPSCADGSQGRGQVMVITGSSNFPPLLAKLAPLIVAAGFTPVYQITSSCRGVRSMFGTATNDRVISDPAPGSTGQPASYFTESGTSVPCSLGTGGAQVDIGESDIFSTTCSGFGPPGNEVGEFLGPIQAFVFVVPGRSQQTAISEEAARAVFGRGGQGGLAAPWINPALYFVRNANTGTQQMIGRAIGVPGEAFWGIDRGTARNVDALLRVITDATAAEQAIGIISTDFYDSDRVNLKALGFKSSDQECAYLPDSSELRKDKRNVRDGHYPIWGPLHFFATVSNGVPVSPAAQAFASVVSVPNVQKELLDSFIGASLVPPCAMTVQRDSELGALSSYAPPFQCGCYFEASPDVNGAPSASCKPCSNSNDCTDPARPACNLGYCEAQ
jgi:ABC-type phosphate transport system substrate-binding protein